MFTRIYTDKINTHDQRRAFEEGVKHIIERHPAAGGDLLDRAYAIRKGG